MNGNITRIILFVKDVPKVSEFYREILGMKVIGKVDPEWTELNGGGCNLALHKAHKTYLRKVASPAKIVFETKDVAKTKRLIEKRKCKMGKIISFDGIKFCDGEDPEGNKFQISNR